MANKKRVEVEEEAIPDFTEVRIAPVEQELIEIRMMIRTAYTCN